MKNKFTKRDFKFFFLGVGTILFISLILDWPEVKSGFIDGFNQFK